MQPSETFSRLINEKINFELPLSRSLTALDDLLKSFSIAPTSPQALAAYEFVCSRYICLSPSSSSLDSSPPRPSPPSDIADPEAFTHFSFAKVERPFGKNYANKAKPQQLFSNNLNPEGLLMKSEEAPLVKKIGNKSPKLALSAFQLSGFDPLNSFHSLDDLKEASRPKQQQLHSKEQLLQTVLKRKFLAEIIHMIQVEKKLVRKQLKIKAANFFYTSMIIRKSFFSLQKQRDRCQKQQKLAFGFSQKKNETLLEDYFYAWKERTNMTEAERNFQTEINNKYETLSRIRFLRQLRVYHQKVKIREDQSQQRFNVLKESLSKMKKRLFFNNLKKKIQFFCQMAEKDKQLNKLIKNVNLKALEKTVGKFQLFRSLREKDRFNYFLKQFWGPRLLQRIRRTMEIRKVYWKKPQKIIFIDMLLENLNESFQRKGYKFQWMEELPTCLERTDSHLGFTARRWKLNKVFKALRNRLEEERAYSIEVGMIHGRRIIKKLLENYRCSILGQKINIQAERLSQYLIAKSHKQFFNALMKRREESTAKKAEELRERLIRGRGSTALKYLAAHRMALNFHNHRLRSFISKREACLILQVWREFKQTTLMEIVNKNIVREFLEYSRLSLLRTIFAGFKAYAFSQRVIRKRTETMRKLRVASCFETLIFNMRVNLFGRNKQREIYFTEKQRKLIFSQTRRKFQHFIRVNRREALKKRVLKQVRKESQSKLQWMAFQGLKLVAATKKQERELSGHLRQKAQTWAKRRAVDRMVSVLLVSLMVANCERVGLFCLKRDAYAAVKKASFSVLELEPDFKD